MAKKSMYGKKGFTDPVLKKLKKVCEDPRRAGSFIRCHKVPAKQLVAIRKFLPDSNIADRQNDSPQLYDFIKFAEKCPTATFISYIVTKERDDERFMVEGVTYPTRCRVAASNLKAEALEKPVEDYKIDGTRRFWWD